MSAELGTLLRALLDDESRLAALTHEQERGSWSPVSAPSWVRRGASSAGCRTGPPLRGAEGDLLTVDEAAALLRVSPRWLYRHAKTLPFARKLSRKVLRFSRAGIARYLATKRP